MTQNVKISIIIPVYNAADFLPRAVGSVLMQEFDDFEVILVDDGSTDGTDKLIKGFQKEKFLNIRYDKKKNGGKHTAINYGAKKRLQRYNFM